jgi:4-amino-4-deoxy-L-arabinose transferase-like glycosyltransferase
MRDKVFVIILSLVTFFAFNAALPTDIMESRNIVTARDMAASGNWLVPTMNGELRLEKPPLPTWVAGAIETVCPRSLSAQRAAAGVMGLMWTLFLYGFAQLLTGRRRFALLTVMVFLTSYHIVVMGRTATWDIYCHAFMMGGIYCLTRGLLDDRRRQWRWFPAAGLMMGLSFLSKGPVSFYTLLLPALIAVIAFLHPSLKGKWPAFVAMIVICLVVGGWWYAYLLLCQPQAVDAVIHKETGAWTDHNVRPWYYYWRFFTETGVWTVMMLAALAIPYWKKVANDRRTYLFAIVWTLSALVLLSLMPEKKIRYLLPMMAPCALCVACLIEQTLTTSDKVGVIALSVTGYIVAVVCLTLPVAVVVLKWVSLSLAVAIVALAIALAIWLIRSTLKRQLMHVVYGICLLFMLLECFLLSPIGKVFGNPDAHSISLTQTMPEARNLPFYHAKSDTLRIEIVYEAGKDILPIDCNDSIAVMRRLPFVLVSHGDAAQVLPQAVLQRVDTLSLGTFDDNKHPRSDRHYTKEFLTKATVIKAKQQ